MKRLALVLVLVVAGLVGSLAQNAAQGGGDQFLDGIGETALVARYAFNGNAEDSSRNQFHGTLKGPSPTFVDDAGRKALLVTGDGSYVQLPSNALAGEDAIAVTGWLYLPTRASGPIFDFGQSAKTHLIASIDSTQKLISTVTIDGQVRGETAPKTVVENQWSHFAVVLDPGARTLTTYVDGLRAGQATGVNASVSQIVPQTATTNRLFFGKSQDDAAPTMHGRLRDVRIYRIPLGDEPVAAIRRAATPAQQAARGRGAAPEISIADIPRESPFAARLVTVPDVTVETVVNMMPRLPVMVPATYAGGVAGNVRVIWPSPTDNVQVRQTGTFSIVGRVPGTRFEPKATVIVKVPVGTMTPPDRLVEAFPLSQVTLNKDARGNDTQFIKNRDKFLKGLAASNPDSFLYNFRDAFGQPQPAGAVALEGWDNQTTRLRGHASGHYLTAIAQAYASTGYDPALQKVFLEKMNYLVDTLYDLSQKSGKPQQAGGVFNADPVKVPVGEGRQNYDSNLRKGQIRTDYQNWGTGFISAYPPDQFIMLERGATYGTQDSQIWAPYYTLHKILAGLLDTYEITGNKKALDIARNMGGWVYTRLNALPAETRIAMWNRYIAGEYGGMNEAMARLFRLTGEKRFVDTAKLFDNTTVFFGNANKEGGLAKRVDTIRGKHANQHIPQITGALETFRDTKEMPYYQIASNFWEIVNASYTYSIGGVAGAKNPNNAECFPGQPDTLWENGFATGGQNETCATYNILKLDRQLFMYDQTAKYMDHYERALYNHILASVAEDNAGNTYHVPLNPGARKNFGNANMSGFTCCNGTALESNTKLQDTIYFRSANQQALYVNLFVPSTVNWTERKITVQQITDYPYADTTKIVVKGSGKFDLKVRVPSWATKGFFVKINGKDEAVKATPGTYLTLARTWKDNDTVELRMPFKFSLDHVPDQPNVASLFYGPVLLAAEEAAARTDWRRVEFDGADPGKSVAGDPATLRFTVAGVPFKPFYESYGRHSVYLHVVLK